MRNSILSLAVATAWAMPVLQDDLYGGVSSAALADAGDMKVLESGIDGVMASQDPKLVAIKGFIKDCASAEAKAKALKMAKKEFAPMSGALAVALEPLGFEAPTTRAEFDAVIAKLSALHGLDAPDIDDYTAADGSVYEVEYITDFETWSQTVRSVHTAMDRVDQAYAGFTAMSQAQRAASDAEDAASEAALMAALVAGMNAAGDQVVTEDDISPEMFEWVSARLGVGGDSDGLIAEYVARFN